MVFETTRRYIPDILDWFGDDIKITITDKIIQPESNQPVKITIPAVNLNAMKYWAMQYGLYIKIIEPLFLVQEVKKNLAQALSKY